ncbi:NUDIX hydrolase [Nocardioides jishulii]|nr:NUDIX domain-containing protein [Nocardioides jishulii]
MTGALHADALARLVEWDPVAGRQSRLRDRFVDHLTSQPDGMSRSCFPDHVTAGVLVLSSDLDHVLLNLHRKAQRWFAFGGHCEPGDASLADAALREGLEESGLETLRLDPVPVHLDEHEVDFCDPRGTVRHLDVRFTALAPDGALHRVSEESLDVRWWPVSALPDDLEDEMHELVATARGRWATRPEPTTGPELTTRQGLTHQG